MSTRHFVVSVHDDGRTSVQPYTPPTAGRVERHAPVTAGQVQPQSASTPRVHYQKTTPDGTSQRVGPLYASEAHARLACKDCGFVTCRCGAPGDPKIMDRVLKLQEERRKLYNY